MIDCSYDHEVSQLGFFLSQGNRIRKTLGLQILKGGEGALKLIST